MKKTLIALAVLGATAGVAYAQSNVTIYGIVDTGYIKQTGADTKMGENINNRIGFKGVEDLGDGLKATFQLEKRFNLYDGSNNSKTSKDFEGAANVGLKHNDWGWVRLGRVNGIATENIRRFDPFYQYGVGTMWFSTQRGVRTDNTLRYDSPDWAGFKLQAAYMLGKNMNSSSRDDGSDKNALIDGKNHSRGNDNDGYAIGLNYKYGGFDVTGNYQVLADSNRSSMWNIGLAYSWDTVKLEALYQHTRDKGVINGQDSSPSFQSYWGDNGWDSTGSADIDQALLGVEWKVGPGRLNASAQWMSVETKGQLYDSAKKKKKDKIDADAWKLALGYTYNLSKRTSLYGIVSYTDWDNANYQKVDGVKDKKTKTYISSIYDDANIDSTTAIQVGITHKF